MKGEPESIGVEYDQRLRDSAVTEEREWLNKGILPDHYREGLVWLGEQSESTFYRQHREMSVAVISINPPVMEIAKPEEILQRAIKRWGERPIAIRYFRKFATYD